MLHLLVASFRALPLDLMVPVSRRGFVWIFSWIFFPPFCFFPVPFSLGFSIQTRYLSSIVSLDTFAHAHSPTFAGSKCQKKFGTIYHFWCEPDLVESGVNRAHLPSRQSFSTIAETAGHAEEKEKRKKKMLFVASDSVWEETLWEMRCWVFFFCLFYSP